MTHLSPRALQGLKQYQYKSGGYTLLDGFHTPIWNGKSCQTYLLLALSSLHPNTNPHCFLAFRRCRASAALVGTKLDYTDWRICSGSCVRSYLVLFARPSRYINKLRPLSCWSCQVYPMQLVGHACCRFCAPVVVLFQWLLCVLVSAP